MMQTVREGKAIIRIRAADKISKEMDVFYNPIMKLNRDISVLLLTALGKRGMRIGLPLEGTGIRGIRFLKELKKGMIQSIAFNDYSTKAVDSMRKNLAMNKIKGVATIQGNNKKERTEKKIELYCKEATIFLLTSKGFDYIDIDPFGTSNPFLDSAVKRISRDGILAVTNTDTASLSGTYPTVCKRLYWATPKNNFLMHEIGLRILIRKIQLIGMQHEKALIPIFSYAKDHYFRIFFMCKKSKNDCDGIVKAHGMFANAGPMWLGRLWDEKVVKKIYDHASKESCKATKKIKMSGNTGVVDNSKDLISFLGIIKEESKIDSVGFYDTHQKGIKKIIKKELLINVLRDQGHQASQTHFSGTGIRTSASEQIIKDSCKGK